MNMKIRPSIICASGRHLRHSYQKIMDAAVRPRQTDVRRPDAPTEVVAAAEFNTDIAKAKALMAEPAIPTLRHHARSISGSPASTSRSACPGGPPRSAQGTINKIPGATWRTELRRCFALHQRVLGLARSRYFFIWCYHGKNSIFNTMSYQSKDMDADRRASRRRRATRPATRT
jgi:peptide/nickel transport system substrate-binding protein